MTHTPPSSRYLRALFRAWPFLFLALAGTCTACHPRLMKYDAATQAGVLSPADSLLGEQFPLPDHLATQQALLRQHSQPARRVIRPDDKALAGNFNCGVIDLVFDEIDGEPSYLYGHLDGAPADERLEFVIYGIPDRRLAQLQVGQHCRVHWIETVVDTEPFDEDRYRYFLAFGVE